MHTVRVGVLMGGMSAEQEVSFNSGRTICDHLDINRYTIIPLFQRYDGALFLLPYKFLHRGKITDFIDRLEAEAERVTWDALRTLVDFLYLAVHGKYAEDGTLQGMLEVLGIPYLGSRVYASAVCMDKSFTKKILAMHKIAVPRDIVLNPPTKTAEVSLQAIEAQLEKVNLSYPLVVKPQSEGSSIGVSIVRTSADPLTALHKAWYVNPTAPQPALIEECIQGMEFSCILLRDYQNNCWLPLPPTEIVPEAHIGFFDYEQKYMPGRSHKFTPARCSEALMQRIQDTCARVSDILEIKTISRIDGFLQADGTVVIVDPNTLSGMGPASFLFREAAELNLSHTQVINYLIETELFQYGNIGDVAHTETRKKEENMQKIRVAVLFGGDSNEREISLESGRNVVYKLSPDRYTVMPLFVTDTMELYQIDQSLLVRNSTHEITQLLDRATKIAWHDLPQHADFVFIALHGGKGENGAVQGALEMLKLPYNGSGVIASALCMDKYKTTKLLNYQNIPVPGNILINKAAWEQNKEHIIEEVVNTLGFPCIVKPHDDGCSVLVARAKTKDELIEAADSIFQTGKRSVLFEEFIVGMELTIGVVGNNNPYALPPSQAVASGGILSLIEKFLPGAGQNITPAPLPQEALKLAQDTVVAAYKATGCAGYARIDCFYQDAHQSPTGIPRVVILEINSLPGLTPATCLFHQAAEVGMKPMDLIDTIVSLGLEKHRAQSAHRVSDEVQNIVFDQPEEQNISH